MRGLIFYFLGVCWYENQCAVQNPSEWINFNKIGSCQMPIFIQAKCSNVMQIKLKVREWEGR